MILSLYVSLFICFRLSPLSFQFRILTQRWSQAEQLVLQPRLCWKRTSHRGSELIPGVCSCVAHKLFGISSGWKMLKNVEDGVWFSVFFSDISFGALELWIKKKYWRFVAIYCFIAIRWVVLGQRSPATPHLKRTATPCANAVQHLSRMEYVDRVLTVDRVDSLSVSKSSLVCTEAVQSCTKLSLGGQWAECHDGNSFAASCRGAKMFQTFSDTFTKLHICDHLCVYFGCCRKNLRAWMWLPVSQVYRVGISRYSIL